MKIEHITTGGGRDFFRITDERGSTVTMTPDDALIVLQFLYENVDDIMRLVSTPDREPFLQPTRPIWAQGDEE